jgi:Domain of unknown function (DUF1737)
VQYRIARSDKPDGLVFQVTAYIKAGWTPLGGVCAYVSGGALTVFQAVTADDQAADPMLPRHLSGGSHKGAPKA